MNDVKFNGIGLKRTTSEGREVQVIRGEGGQYWGFKFGPEDDQIAFCLSAEAVEIVMSLMTSLESRRLNWRVLAPTTDATSSDYEPPQS